MGFCAWDPASAAPCDSWLGCWGLCVFVCALRVYSATPGWGVRCGGVCLGSGLGCAPPLLAGVLVCVYVCVRAPLVPRHSWLGCAVWVCVPGLEFRLRPATPGGGVGVSLCLCAHSACTPPLLAGVCGVGPCASARLSAAPHHSPLGCWGVCVFAGALRLYPATPCWGVRWRCVSLGSAFGCAPPLLAGVFGCVCRCAPSACTPPFLAGVCGVWVGCCLAPVPVPWFVVGCARCPGLRHPVAIVAWHLFVCLGCGPRLASLPCLVAPHWCAAPRPVRLLPVLRSAFLTPWCPSRTRGLAPPDLLGGCAGHVQAGPEPGSLCLPLAAAEAAALGFLPLVTVPGPALRLSLAGPSGVGLGLRALRWFACVDPVTDASGFPYRPSFDGGLGECTGAFCTDAYTAPFESEDATPGSRAFVRVCAPLGRVGRAVLPGAFRYPSTFPLTTLGVLFVCSPPPPRLELPCWWLLVCFLFCFFFLFSSFLRPRCLWRSVFSSPGCHGPWHLVPPPHFFWFFFLLHPPLPVFFFSLPACLLIFVCSVFFSAPDLHCWGGLCVLGRGVSWCALLWAFRPGGGRYALVLCRSVLPGFTCSLCVVACRVARVQWRRAGGVSLLRAASGVLLVCFVLWSCSAALAACFCP